jgi:hypothetical protein
MNAHPFAESATQAVASSFSRIRSSILRLVHDDLFPELETWGGAAKLFGLWLLLLIGFVLTPVYVLVRLPTRPGGWRFAVMGVGIVLAGGFVALLVFLSAGLAGLGGIK